MNELAQLRPNKRRDSALRDSARCQEQLSLIGVTTDGMLRMGCLGELGHQVIGVDNGGIGGVDLDAWVGGCEEPYLQKMLEDAADATLLTLGVSIAAAVQSSDVTLLCCDVPVDGRGACDLAALEAAVVALGEAIADKGLYHTVIVCSPVPPGTTLGYIVPTLERGCQGRLGEDFGVVVWPLVLRKGQAVRDFFTQKRMAVAASDLRAMRSLSRLLEDLDCELVAASFAAAELHSFAINAWRAMQRSFNTELGQLCTALDIVDTGNVLPRDAMSGDGESKTVPQTPTRAAASTWMQQMDAVRALGFFAESLCLAAPTIAGLGGGDAAEQTGLPRYRSYRDLH